jgi:hypothetical protein
VWLFAAVVTRPIGRAKKAPKMIPIEITAPTREPVSYFSASGTVPGALMAQSVEKYPLVRPKTRAFVMMNQSLLNTPVVEKMIGRKVAKNSILLKAPHKIVFLLSMAQDLPPIVLPAVSPTLKSSNMNSWNQLVSLSVMSLTMKPILVSSMTPGKKTKVVVKMKIIAIKYPLVIDNCL